MKRILTASMLVAVAAFTAAPALAATTSAKATTSTMAPAKPAAKMAAATPAKPTVLSFKLIDANHDGKISYTELKKYFPKLTKAAFAKYAAKDGFMDHAGLAAFFKAQKAADAAAAKATTSKMTAKTK